MNKMKKIKQWLVVLFVAIALSFAGLSDALARKSGGGGFSRSSPSRSSPSKSTGRSSSKSTKPSSSSRSTSKPKRTAAQSKSYEAAKKNGTAKMTKSQSTSKFKNDAAMKKKYTSSYATKPATRPTHIPSTYASGGNTYNINYNSGQGGYGYMNGGSWIAYSYMSMATASMMTNSMNSNSYYHQGHPAMGTTIVHSGGSGIMIFVWVVLSLVVIAIFIGWVASRKSS